MTPTREQIAQYTFEFPKYTEKSVLRALEALLSDPNNSNGKIDLHSVRFVLEDNSGSPVGILKKSYRSFDEYVADNPEGGSFRNWITAGASRPVLIFPSIGGGLPGGFFWANCIYQLNDPSIKKILVHDSDDGLWEKEVSTSIEEEFRLLESLAPMSFQELGLFGYRP